MEQYAYLLYEVDREKHVATVTLNRPRYRNALSRRLSEEVGAAFQEAASDNDVHVILLKGAGDVFSAGHDLGTPEELADREQRPWGDAPRDRFMRSYTIDVERLLMLRDIPKPTVAAVQGHCIFAGWMLASAMDVIIAADNAQFLATHFQYFSVPWDLGVRNAKGALFENKFLTADEAHEMGLVYRVVPLAELNQAAEDYAARVATGEPFQLRTMKAAINQVEDQAGFRTHIITTHAQMLAGSAGATGANRPVGRVNSIVARARQ